MKSPFLALFCALSFAAAANSSHADTIELNSHQEIPGMVTKYANYTFEIRSADGKTMNCPASSVHRITFDSSTTPANFTTRTSGVQQAVASKFENGVFEVTTPSGPRQFPLIFIERVAFRADRGQEIEVLSHGQTVDVNQHLAAGNITVVEFYADWCGPCRKVAPLLEQMARKDPEIAVRKIDIVNWQSAVAS